MNRWGKVLNALCEESISEGLELYILEADSELNWFGVKLSDLCSEENLSKEDAELFKEVKGAVSEKLSAGPFVAYVSPINFQVDIYESDRKRFASSNTSRPFGITREGFRLGFFNDRSSAVDFFLKVAKRLREKGINLHLFY
jgi:hypothetical protein